MNVVLFSNNCPRCNTLKHKLDSADVDYSVLNNFDEIMERGFQAAPVLKVDDEYYDFGEAINWVNKL